MLCIVCVGNIMTPEHLFSYQTLLGFSDQNSLTML